MTTTPACAPAAPLDVSGHAAGGRSLLPMVGHTQGKRSPVTCHLKCADACFHPVPNTSPNEYFRDVASRALSRRAVLGGAGAGALALVVGAALPPSSAAAEPLASGKGGGSRAGLAFGAITSQLATQDAFTVPDGYAWRPVIRWGDPILPGGRDLDLANQTEAQQLLQFGYNNDYLDLMPLDDCKGRGFYNGRRQEFSRKRGKGRGKDTGKPRSSSRKALLVANHEYVNPSIMFSPTDDPAVLSEQRRVAMAAQGMAVVELRRKRAGQPWTYQVSSDYNRRIHTGTAFDVSGPAAGSPLLRTVADPSGTTILGTLGNCAGGTTPWGTVLSGEENFNGYFRTAGTSAGDARYGLRDSATSGGWEHEDPRFDARNPGYENEPNRFGWIVELDPYEPDAAPVKHTALGRFKHEGANVCLSADARAVAYMGDDERFDYLYKFVSTQRMLPGGSKKDRAHNKQLLSSGSLYVARFSGTSPAEEIDGTGTLPSDGAFDGTGEWVPLTIDGVSQVPGFADDEVVVLARLAADAVGATKMDRCEDVEPSPTTGRVYVACTNNTNRGKTGQEGATEVNPRLANRDGHVVEIAEDGGDAASTTFRWSLLLVCGDPSRNVSTYFAGFPADRVSPISCPDNVAFDDSGDLWISTDGQPGTIGLADGLFKVPLEGAERGHVQQFLAVPVDAETCGPVIHQDDQMVFVAVQHPGEDGTVAAPTSTFPDYVPAGATAPAGAVAGPRPSVVQGWRA
jgi:uncharacterized protein